MPGLIRNSELVILRAWVTSAVRDPTERFNDAGRRCGVSSQRAAEVVRATTLAQRQAAAREGRR